MECGLDFGMISHLSFDMAGHNTRSSLHFYLLAFLCLILMTSSTSCY